ncbi:hypothetical protein F5Y16DRAFT_383445 [Xylariaceae sp. FL0255]|nr:hypothetical protein F5Y16DRAFT_383445 [Xylariaceae sp. FL0255]
MVFSFFSFLFSLFQYFVYPIPPHFSSFFFPSIVLPYRQTRITHFLLKYSHHRRTYSNHAPWVLSPAWKERTITSP